MASIHALGNGVPQTMTDLDITHRIDLCGNALSMSEREWLLTNGTGAYAMGTLPAVNTRRYHGLFVAASRQPVGRVMVLNQTLEQLRYLGHDKVLQFTTCQFRDDTGHNVFEPTGFTALKRFEKGTRVVWHYEHDGVIFKRQLIVQWHKQAATLHYWIEGLKRPAIFSIHPMMTLRDYHELLQRHQAEPFRIDATGACVTVRHRNLVATVSCPQGQFVEEPSWWYSIYYSGETERGQSDREDYFIPGRFEIRPQTLGVTELNLTIALGDQAAEPVIRAELRQQHLAPVFAHLNGIVSPSQVRSTLTIATDDFVVQRPIRGQMLSSILAGYPWFADWGRDTFISLPALLLVTGRFDEARATLATFASAIRDGLVPNRFDDNDDQAAHYNTVDAGLWFAHVAMIYIQVTADHTAWNDWIAKAVKHVVHGYLNGTQGDHRGSQRIEVAQDGLIDAGSPHTQLTWMDAMAEGVVFTPRHGKAVEINALWHHVLVTLAELTSANNPSEAKWYMDLACRVQRAFNSVFWDEQLGYLRDHVYCDEQGDVHIDRSLRPNQIFAVSLPNSPLSEAKQRHILHVVKERLLTPYGLRTLAPDDPNYHGRYTGPPFQRDAAYHQGTIWPWLIGPYAEAVLRVGRFSCTSQHVATQAITGLLGHLANEGLGQLHEIYEADPPHRPVGCMAQAWSIAEVLRVLSMTRSTARYAGSTGSI